MYPPETASSWKMQQSHLSLQMQIENTNKNATIPPCLSVLGFPDNSISAGGGGGLLADQQLLEMGNVM